MAVEPEFSGKLVNVLDKEEFRIKLEEINTLVEKKDYEGAMKVVDSIDWRRVKNVRTLCVVGEIYAANKRYEDSREIFLLAYHRAPIGKNILYRLIEVSLKMGDVEEAEEYYQEFMEVAADDNTHYILNYKIKTARNASLEERIRILEDYKEKEFTEKWSYELAKLYFQAGMKDKCIALCNEMVLWFNDGNYVMKALDLKQRMGVLSDAEKEKLDKHFTPKLKTAKQYEEEKKKAETKAQEEAEGEETAEEEKPRNTLETDETERPIGIISLKNEKELAGVESLQEKISKGIRDIFGSKKEEDSQDQKEEEDKVPEEMIKNSSSPENLKDVPALEKETADGIEQKKMPTLEIPASMKNIDLSKTNKLPEIKRSKAQAPEEKQEEKPNLSEEEKKDFNLEDTILAAATKQGIEIPKKEEKEEKAEAEGHVPSLEEEDFLSEEDLAAAEEEFLHGPQITTGETSKEESEQVSFEAEEASLKEGIKTTQEEEKQKEQDEFADMLKESMDEEGADSAAPQSEEEKLEEFIKSMEPEVDPLDIIPRDRELTEEEEKLFTYFVNVPGMQDQLVDALCDVQEAAADKTSRTGNLVVMGGRETGKTRLIASLIPAICKELNLVASKVAYVFADDINDKDIAKVVDKLSGGFLVIEDANQLTQETVDLLNKAMDFRTDGLIVILEDEKISMRKFLARYPKFARKFTSMINIPVFTNDELVNFARIYAMENGYKINEMGMLALYNKIGENQKEDEPMSVGAVKVMMDAAFSKVEGGFLKFNRKKRVDKDGFITLHEKDFG